MPKQHDGVGVARATHAAATGTRGSPAGAPGLTAMAWWVASMSPCFPLFAANNTLTHSAHATHTPSRLRVPMGRHPGLCLLVTALWHTTPPHTTPHHIIPPHTIAHHTTPHHTAPHHITTAITYLHAPHRKGRTPMYFHEYCKGIIKPGSLRRSPSKMPSQNPRVEYVAQVQNSVVTTVNAEQG